MTGTNLARLHAIIEGRVQGVGFRYFVLEIAQLLGVNGWVRNRWDDTVEVLAEGERPALEKLMDALGRGPRGAFVSNVKADWEKPTGEFHNFRVEMTE
jgi:acylphosphatase